MDDYDDTYYVDWEFFGREHPDLADEIMVNEPDSLDDYYY